MEFEVFTAPANERLDVALSEALERSRSYAKRLVLEGYVQVNGTPVSKPALKLTGSELISVALPPETLEPVVAQGIPLDIIYQDEYLATINKPPNLTAHPTETVRTETVVNALMGRIPLSKDKLFDPNEADYRPGIVHRLDKDTSGVMVVAKTNEAHKHIALSFKKRLTEKEYIAISQGNLEDDVHLDAAIGRHPNQGHKMTVGGTSPRTASTHFRVLARATYKGQIYSFIKAKPHSGRTHQIRVHLKHLGAPILGDATYSKTSPYIARQALHAHRLTLPHPLDNEAITFVAYVPDDMVKAWKAVGGSWPPSDEEL